MKYSFKATLLATSCLIASLSMATPGFSMEQEENQKSSSTPPPSPWKQKEEKKDEKEAAANQAPYNPWISVEKDEIVEVRLGAKR